MKGEWVPPPSFAEYRIVRRLGRGRMGQVFLAQDTFLERPVAVKFIASFDPSPDARRRFLVEARAAARVQHPNVVGIYRVGELDARPYLVSEYVPGKPLDRVPKPLPPAQLLDVALDLARGLAAAHRKGVLHRDLKPGNTILADDGSAKILDFGLAKLFGGAEKRKVKEKDLLTTTRAEANAAVRKIVQQVRTRPMLEAINAPPASLVSLAEAIMQPVALDAREATYDPRAGEAQPADELPAYLTVNERPRALHLVPEMLEEPETDEHPAAEIDPFDEDTAVPEWVGDGPTPLDEKTKRITGAGALMGTPDYMAPEAWRGGESTPRTDVYSFGAMIYELCAGHAPHAAVPVTRLREVVQVEDAPPLARSAPGIDPRLAAIVEQCLRRDPLQRFASGEEVREALEELASEKTGAPIPEGNPYRGLNPFEASHRALFFGRAADVAAVLDRLRSDGLLIVTGDSGVGKTSLCRAGVIPAAIEEGLDGTRRWSSIDVPLGPQPASSLAAVLCDRLGMTQQEATQAILRGDPAELTGKLRAQLGGGEGLIVFVDGLEDLLSARSNEEALRVEAFFAALASAHPELRVLATARTDALSRLAAFPRLSGEISRALHVLRPLSQERLREAIVGPARATGVRFESDDLVGALVQAAAAGSTGAKGAMPLLQFALSELWEARDRERHLITTAALDELGGVSGALAAHAEQVVGALLTSERAIARKLLLRLVDASGSRARRTTDELTGGAPSARAVLDALSRGRIVVSEDSDGTIVWELAHEVLIHGWDRMRLWLAEDVDTKAVRDRIAHAAAEWERLGRRRGALWGKEQLEDAGRIDPAALHAAEAEFLSRSREAVRRQRIVRWASVFAVPLLAGIVYAVISLDAYFVRASQVEAELSVAGAELREARAAAATAAAIRREAYAAFDANRDDDAEGHWATAAEMGRRADSAYHTTAGALESALAYDRGGARVRALFAEVLLEHAILNEQLHNDEERDETLARMALYDEDGSRRAAWLAPAHLSIETTPPGALVVVERWVEETARRKRLVPSKSAVKSPIADLELEPGTYRISFAADWRAPVFYPIHLARGERLRLTIELPPEEAVPEGFAYVPPGRFVFGTAADEEARLGFFDTVPAHERVTGGYLIGKREVTFAEWIKFLEALPPAERERRMPSAGSIGLAGNLHLEHAEAGWVLHLQPGAFSHDAPAGTPIAYPTRVHRRAQDWLRFPVVAISADDARAYAAWLASTGRLKGARLCNELEWERAARGSDLREYPHGATLDDDDANFDRTYGKDARAIGPDEVGAHPASRSPFGLDDMAGNAHEWTLSARADGEMVVRGGGYASDRKSNRVSNRTVAMATLRDPTVGMRVCADLTTHPSALVPR